MAVEGEAAAETAQAEFVQGKISVWWDIENCQVPKGSDVNSIAKNIQSALVNMGYRGPISISAYGKNDAIPQSVQDALSSTGISVISVPPGVKDASDKKILVDMLFWAVDNPAPANYLLISGDRDFSNALHQLSMRKYNILLAQPQKASAPLVAAATSVWLWTSLSKGGPPLSKSESQLSVQNSIGSSSNSDSLRNSVSEPTLVSKPMDSSHESSLQKSPSMGKGAEFKNKGKQLQKKVIQCYIPKASVATTAIPEDHSNAKQYKNPLEIPKAYTPSSQPSGQISNDISQLSQQTKPNNVTSQSSFRPSNVLTHDVHVSASSPMPPKPEDPRFSLGFPTNISGISKPNISGTSQNGQNIYFTSHHNQSSGQISKGTNGFTPQYNLLNQSSQPMRSNNVSYPPILQPSNMLTPGAHIRAPSSMPPRPEGPRFNLGFPTNIPDIGKLHISGNPQNSQNVSSFVPQNGPDYRFIPPNHVNPQGQNVGNSPSFFNGNSFGSDFLSSSLSGTSTGMTSNNGEWGTQKYPRPSDYMQGLGGIVLIALNTLKNEKIMPTEVNITGCIYYGDDLRHSNIDVRKALDSAVQQQMVTKHTLGALQVYVRKNEKLWFCVNPLGGNPNQYSKAKWDAIQKFLASSAGKSAILASHCRYEAATIMKKMCLKDLHLGDVIHILHLVVDVKRWITHLSSGWQPLQITLPGPAPI